MKAVKAVRTRKHLLSIAMEMFNTGLFPSVTEIAEKAGVSRATAYRYFPSQSDLIDALVKESLGQVLEWEPKEKTALERVNTLFDLTFPQMLQQEGTLRAALRLSLEEWAKTQASVDSQEDKQYIRGNRKNILHIATEPLHNLLSSNQLSLLQQSLSLIFGSECFLVFKDIWGLNNEEVQQITKWMAKAVINQIERDNQLIEH